MNDPWAFGWTQLLTIVGMCITVGIAFSGFRTFGRWKKEKLEEARIEAAIDALAIAYESKFVFGAIRNRFIHTYEYKDGGMEFDDDGGLGAIRITLRVGQQAPYAVLKRIESHEEFFEKVRKIEPKFMAIFGAQTEEVFALAYEARTKLESTAKSLFDEERIDSSGDDELRDRKRELRSELFGHRDEADMIGGKIEEFRARIERLCRPIVNQKFGKQ